MTTRKYAVKDGDRGIAIALDDDHPLSRYGEVVLVERRGGKWLIVVFDSVSGTASGTRAYLPGSHPIFRDLAMTEQWVEPKEPVVARVGMAVDRVFWSEEIAPSRSNAITVAAVDVREGRVLLDIKGVGRDYHYPHEYQLRCAATGRPLRLPKEGE